MCCCCVLCCSQSEVEKLEKVQLCAARIVTGLPNSVKKSLYLETGWQPLSDGRKLSKLTTMHKIHNSCVTNYFPTLE